MRQVHIVVTCEHAGNEIPKPYQHLFKDAKHVLHSHRGIDEGALSFAEQLSDGLRVKLFETRISRLLVECNRSLSNPSLFSEFTSELKPNVQESILQQYYHPYRNMVEKYIGEKIVTKPVLHLSMHTFTPIWEGNERKIDVSLLYDEERSSERTLCEAWTEKLNQSLPGFDVLKNVPYKGSDDGFTTYLRTKFSADQYMGVEIEINQKWALSAQGDDFVRTLTETLEMVLKDFNIHEPQMQ
ncbi:N-formylglutamate amidohydrolase [Ekhidna sp.]|uniref:N-formylglutamate amidohydrolase n=1 Tax=Ekhidna sp. TaxID=2608089 RepID=UPI0032F02B34